EAHWIVGGATAEEPGGVPAVGVREHPWKDGLQSPHCPSHPATTTAPSSRRRALHARRAPARPFASPIPHPARAPALPRHRLWAIPCVPGCKDAAAPRSLSLRRAMTDEPRDPAAEAR